MIRRDGGPVATHADSDHGMGGNQFQRCFPYFISTGPLTRTGGINAKLFARLLDPRRQLVATKPDRSQENSQDQNEYQQETNGPRSRQLQPFGIRFTRTAAPCDYAE